MKKNAKKGFTTLELVVVIVVVAALAAALAVSLVIVGGMNDELAKMQAQNAQQLEDLQELINNQNYMTAEDFQNKLEEALSKIESISSADVELAVSQAILAYLQNNPINNGLTAEDVTKLVADALENIDTGMSEEDIRDIINDVLSGK